MANERNYVTIAKRYARWAAVESNPSTGKWIKLAARRFLTDLERAKLKTCAFKFDPWHANDPCDFIEKLPHVEGTWASPDIVLDDSDIFLIVQMFGFRLRVDSTRRFTTVLKAIARKNAKSTIAAAIGLYCETCEPEMGPQVITAATTGSQARIVFNIAKRMVEKTPDLQMEFNVQAFANSIANFNNGGSFKPINSKASTQDGLNPSVTIIDEVHAHQNHDLINVLKSAAGARRSPLFLYTTTEGYENAGPWGELREFAKQVLSGAIEAEDCDHFLAIYYAVDDGDSEFDEKVWIKANPLMKSNDILRIEIRKESIEAMHMPGKLAEFKIKRLNRPASVANGWLDLDKWKANNKPMPSDDELAEYPCYAGLDLASSKDICALRLVWVLPDDEIATRGYRWTPAQAIEKRTLRNLVPYAKWVASGHIMQSGVEIVDHEDIFNKIIELHERFNIVKLSYDAWNARQLAARLATEGVDVVEFIQGPRSFHPCMAMIETAYLNGKLIHGNDPVLNWCGSNMIARQDANLNNAPDRKKATDKIDDMVALYMACGPLVLEVEDGTKGNLAQWIKSHQSSPA